MMMIVIGRFLIIFIATNILVNCSSIKETFSTGTSKQKIFYYQKYENSDYSAHLKNLAEQYLSTPGVVSVNLGKQESNYFKKVYDKIVSNNEFLLDKTIEPQFYVINVQYPFYFSLPGGKFFFSLGLIDKYFEHEQWLISALTHEIIRSHLNIYTKRRIVPVGHIQTERLLAITRLPLDFKIEINKWTYLAMQRAGYDSSAFLTWLQTQNKNALDFTLQLGNARNISKEEFMFKNFVAKEGIGEWDTRASESNSSKDFYLFINEIKKNKIIIQ